MEKLKFGIEDVSIMDGEQNSQFATAKIRAFSTGVSLHNTFCDIETLKRVSPTIFEKPIIFEYDRIVDDFGSHPDTKDTIVSGFVVPNSSEFEEHSDGRFSLNVIAKIWKKYSGKFMDVFLDSAKGEKKVSVEIEVNDSKEGEDGIITIRDFVFSAICVLGDLVTEASPGAKMKLLTFSDENKEYKKAYDNEFSSQYSDIDFSISKKIKSNAKLGIDMAAQGNTKKNPVSMAFARWLLKHDEITPEKARAAKKYFDKHKVDIKLSDKSSPEWISWMMWGGNEGRRFCEKLCVFMDEADEKRLSYYSVRSSDDEVGEENINREETEEKMAEEKEKEEKPEEKEEVKEEEKMSSEQEAEKEEFAGSSEESAPNGDDEEEDDDENEEEFSLSAYLDVTGALAFLDAETGAVEEEIAAREIRGDAVFSLGRLGSVIKGMYSVMCKMNQRMMTLMSENAELKSFKASTNEKEKSFAIDKTLSELQERVIIPDDALVEMREEAKKFSLDDIEGWKNYCKAKSFDFSLKEKKPEPEIVRVGLPFGTHKNKKENLWK